MWRLVIFDALTNRERVFPVLDDLEAVLHFGRWWADRYPEDLTMVVDC